MNSKQPELTIFQGIPSIHVDNNQARIEEEEAIEDQKRRQKELQIELEREFGNITYNDDDIEEDGTMYSTRNDRSLDMQKQLNSRKDFSLRDDLAHLRNLVETKDRELEQLSNILTVERQNHKAMIDEYEKRLAISEAEKERALMNRNQTHELLVENKGKLIELNDKNQNFSSKIKSLEIENERLISEIESTKLMLSDVQSKYNMVEKNVMFNAERNTDIIIKQSQERHIAQMTMMQQQIESLKSKYDDLEHEYKHLDIRYKELQRSRESILIEKGEIINQLNRNLEESQRHCQDLMSRPDLTQENRRLQNALQTLEYQNQEMSLTVNKLQKKIQEQTSEMEMIDSIIIECDGNNQSFAEISKFLNRDPLKNVNSTPMTADAKMSKIKEELCKSLNNIKRKREEIKILEKQLAEKDDEISELKRDESKTLIELDKFREEAFRLKTKVNLIQNELTQAQNELKSHKNSDYKQQNEMLCRELDTKKHECEDLRSMIEELKMNQSEISQRLENEKKKLEELTNEARKKQVMTDEKINKSIQLDSSCEACTENKAIIEKLELSRVELENSKEKNLIEINNLVQKLSEAQQTIEKLEEKISLHNLRDQEIEKLQQKAKEFENFMMTNTRKDSVTAKSTSQDSSNNTSQIDNQLPESDSKDTSDKSHNESKVRDEMARVFASQIKIVEKRFIEEAKKLHDEIGILSNELELKTTNLEIATEQLELLKFTIVHERHEFETNLKKQEEYYKENFEKYQQHVAELNSQIDMIDDERNAIQKIKKQIENERKLLAKKEEDTLLKLKKLQQESTEIIQNLNDKYKTAKKTALNYKQYSDEKEKHYRNECERIKNGYADAVDKIQARVNETLKEKEQSYNEKIKRIEQEYEFKIDILKGMLEKSQKQ